ncbi:hypothetical protein DL96DRAFT_1625681 [Flagelloscypha sp. PMI_526]|nr:hypothetical protein DL96DRAFT_1625681 [Flagelloscypha sp. PMI_526]
MQFSTDPDLSPYERMLSFIQNCIASGSHDYYSAMNLYYSVRVPDDLLSPIGGNAPRPCKEVPLKLLSMFRTTQGGFAHGPGHRARIVEVNLDPSKEDNERMVGTVIQELVVEKDMVNGQGNLDGGVAPWLIDEGSTLAYAVAKTALNPLKAFEGHSTASAFIEEYFHGTARLGDTIRAISTSKTSGIIDQVCRTEVRNITTNKLIASGNQIKSPTMANNQPWKEKNPKWKGKEDKLNLEEFQAKL